MSDEQKIWYGIHERHHDNGNATGLLNGPFGCLADKRLAEKVAREMFGERGHVAEINPDHMGQWGGGEQAKTEKAFDTVMVGETLVELVHGEHPHSRCDRNTYARFPDGSIEGFDGHRILWGVQLQEFNYLKESGLSGSEVREGGTGLVFANDRQVYEFFFRDIEHALSEAASIIAKLKDCPISLWDQREVERLPGRKVYYCHHPTVVDHVVLDRGCVVLRADPAPFPVPPWRKEQDDLDDDSGDRTVLIEVWSKDIWWWRE